MIQNIQMTQVFCDHEDHKAQLISALCRRTQCQARSACCQKCVDQFHQECSKHIVFYDDVPKLVSKIQNLETVYEDLLSKVSNLLKDIKKALDSLLSPLKVYEDSPNMGNLNILGDLLRQIHTTLVHQLFGQNKKIITDQLTKLLRLIQEPSQSNKDKAEKLYQESIEQYQKDQPKAFDCIEKAIQLVPNNEKYWLQKGQWLHDLMRYEDSIESLNQSISIKHNHLAYFWKGQSLSRLNKLEEAINCAKQGLNYFPNHSKLFFQLISFDSLLQQSN